MASIRTHKLDQVEVKCNWCGKLVLAFLARYRDGSFYHKDCFIERIEANVKDNLENPS